MSFFLFLSQLSFEYESARELLFDNCSIQFQTGWTGLVGANGAGKTTLLHLIAGKLKPDAGAVHHSGDVALCEQEVVAPPADCEQLFSSCSREAFQLRDHLRLAPEMAERWETLSMGERKKIQIGCALFSAPDILCLDEPTNHLDGAGRQLLIRELRRFRGIGVLVSHDRELLDQLCSQTVFLNAGKAELYSGGVSAGREQQRIELENQLERQHLLKRELKRNRQELQRRREKEQSTRSQDAKRKLDRHDHDGKEKIDAARVSGRDRRAGDLAGRQAVRVGRTAEALAELGKIRKPEYGLTIPYGCCSTRNALYEAERDTLTLGKRLVQLPPLTIGNRDRIALTGENGAGKSTLLRRIISGLTLDAAEYLYMPQEFDAEMTASIYHELRQLSRAEFSKVMNVVASLGSSPERVLDSADCSPGEWRKLFFGLGVLRPVKLIIMDEPTNHLDLPSIECLEHALAGCGSALLLISHDTRFLQNLCPIHWQIRNNLLCRGYFSVK